MKRKNREESLFNITIQINPDYLEYPKLQKSKTENNLLSKNKNNKKKINNHFYKTIYKKPSNHNIKKTTYLGRKVPVPKFSPDKNLHDYLYIESKILRNKKNKEIQEYMETNYPFKPDISKSFDKTEYYNNQNNRSKNKFDVFNRLYAINQKKNKAKYYTPEPKLRKKENKKIKKQKENIIKNQHNIFPKIRENFVSYEDFMRENKRNQESLNQKLKIGRERLYYDARRNKYIELFKCLDSDNDGIISCKKIKLSLLDNKTLIFLGPLLKKLQYHNIKMDFNMFYDEIKKLKKFSNVSMKMG